MRRPTRPLGTVVGSFLTVVLATVSLAVTAAPSTAQDEIAAIRGYVRSMADVEVTAYALVEGQWVPRASTSTASSGGYQLTVSPGTYRVGFVPPSPDYESVFWQHAASVENATDVVLEADEIEIVDTALLPATRVEGTVRDSTGQPVPNARVALTKLGSSHTWNGAGNTETGADGRYVLGVFGAGVYRVSASLGTGATGGHIVIDRRGQHVTGQDLVLPASAKISGTVLDEKGAVLYGADVEVLRRDQGRFVTAGTTYVDQSGRYELGGLSAGTYRVRAEDSGLDRYAPEYWPDGPRLEDGHDIEVTDGGSVEVPDIQLDLVPLGHLYAAEGPSISGNPKVGSKLSADPGFWGWVTGIRYAYQWYADGRAIVGARGAIYRPTRAQAGKPIAVQVTASVNYAAPGVAYSPPTGKVRARATRSPQVGSTQSLAAQASAFGDAGIAGRLTGESGAPLTGAAISAVRVESSRSEVVQTVLTDANGGYHLAALVPGDYFVQFRPSVEAPGNVPGRVPASGTITIQGSETHEGVDAQLAAAPTIQGQVALATGAAVPYAEVTIYKDDGFDSHEYSTVRADAAGRYTAVVPAGTYRVGFSRPGYDLAPSYWPSANGPESGDDVVVRSGEATTGIDGTLVPASRIRGTVHSERTGYIVPADVLLYRLTDRGWEEDHPFPFNFLVDRFGRFDLAGLPAGTYRVGFDPSAPYTHEYWDNASTLESSNDIVVSPGAVVSGKDVLLADTGKPYPVRVVNVKAPQLTGTPKVGRTLQVTSGTWSPSTARLTYQWLAAGKRIRGAVGTSFKVPKALLGKRITVEVRASDRYWLPEAITTRPTAKVTR